MLYIVLIFLSYPNDGIIKVHYLTMKILFLMGPAWAREIACGLLQKSGVCYKIESVYTYLKRPERTEVELERENISILANSPKLIEIVEEIIRKNQGGDLLVINGFPKDEIEVDYLAAVINRRYKVAVLHVEPSLSVYTQRGEPETSRRSWEEYDRTIRTAAYRLADDMPVQHLQFKNMDIVEDVPEVMFISVLKILSELGCVFDTNNCPTTHEITREVSAPNRLALFRLVSRRPGISSACPHIDPALIL